MDHSGTRPPHERLPSDLGGLDRELRSIRFMERPSLGPELQAELERAAARAGPRPRPLRRRLLVGSAVALAGAGLFVAGAAAPGARGALVAFLRAVVTDAENSLGPDAEAGPPEERAGEATDGPVASTERLEPEAASGEGASAAALSMPMLRDVAVAEALVRRRYPPDLQRAGQGGRVRLRVHVDAEGAVRDVRVVKSSGIARLDAAARNAALEFTFYPARRGDRQMPAWVEVPVHFASPLYVEARGEVVSRPTEPPAAGASARVETAAAPAAPSDRGHGRVAEIRAGVLDGRDRVTPEPGQPGPAAADTRADARASEDEALRDEGVVWQWRQEAVSALERAVALDPEHPSPFLALGRIRKKQGARSEAMRLFERGLQRAAGSDRPVPPRVLADLHYERGLLLREEWLAWEYLGRLPESALERARCPLPAAAGPAARPLADRLVAWNYLCPQEFHEVIERSLIPLSARGAGARQAMLGAFEAALNAMPSHAGAAIELLLAAADEADWERVLEGAGRFASESEDDPEGYLLAGLALHALARCELAHAWFEQALERLSPEEALRFRDPAALLTPDAAARLSGLDEAGRRDAARRIWTALDPVAITEVNERMVEHYARAAYAWLRFGSLETSPARVWLRYGPPLQIRAVGEGTAMRTVFWDYGTGPDLTFRGPAGDGTLELTPEGRAYLDELRGSRPQRGGRGPVRVESLEAQLARFRSVRPGAVELELHTRVPPAMAGASAADSLEVGVLVVDDEGERRILERIRVPARERPLSFRLDEPLPAGLVVLELLDATRTRAYRFSAPLALEGLRPDGPGISDLLLLAEAPAPGELAARAATWVRPLAGAVAPGDRLFALFEVYGLRPDAYAVEVLLESVEGRRAEPVPFERHHPPGAQIAPWSEGEAVEVATEVLSVDLREVAAGVHWLRVRAVPLADAEILESRRLVTIP